jgi:ankyrin repeat protein
MACMVIHTINTKNELKARKMIENIITNMSIDIEFIFNYKATSMGDTTILIIACKYGMDKIALRILNCVGTQLNLKHKDSHGKTALNYATLNGSRKVALKILEIEKLIKMIDLL